MSAQCIGFEASLLFTSHKGYKGFLVESQSGAPHAPCPTSRMPQAQRRTLSFSHARSGAAARGIRHGTRFMHHGNWHHAMAAGARSARRTSGSARALRPAFVPGSLSLARLNTLVALPASRLSRNPQASCNGGRERSVRLHAMGRTALTDRALHCALPHRDERRDRLAHERRQGSRRRRRRRRRRWQR